MTTDQILDALQITREQFGNLLLRAQEGKAVNEIYRIESSAESDDRAAFRYAIEHVRKNGTLGKFLLLIFKAGFDNGRLADYLLPPSDADHHKSELQAFTNYTHGFSDPITAINGLRNATRWTCKVYVNNVPTGTGVLIGPNLVLTAWHVLKPYFEKQGNKYVERKTITGLFAEFNSIYDTVNGQNVQRTSEKIPSHKDWWVGWCPCHDAELKDEHPDPLGDLNNCWDYVIFRISKPIGTELNWAIPDKTQPIPNVREKVTVFQHPQQQAMTYDEDEIATLTPPDLSIVPGLRFLHTANTTYGSSGGPVFNKNFNLIGVHQGVWQKNETHVVNKGVPLSRIIDDMERRFGALPAPEGQDLKLFMITKPDGTVEPLIGTDDYQELLWASLVNGKKRLIILEGGRGMGKNLRIRLLDEIVKDSANLKLKLSASVFSKMKALEFVDHIAPFTGISTESITPLAKYNTTSSAWLKDEVAYKVLQGLSAKRDNKNVWIILTDLELHSIDGEHLKEFLMQLNEHLVSNEWLRIVLCGSNQNVPQAIADLTARPIAEKFTEDEIITFFKRYFASNNINGQDPKPFVKTLYRLYDKYHTSSRETAKASLITEIVETLKDLTNS